MDIDPDFDFQVDLIRRNFDNNGFVGIAGIQTSGGSSSVRTMSTSTISNGVVDNSQYYYEIIVYFPTPYDDFSLIGASIEYTINQPY